MASLFRLNAHQRFYQRAENLPVSHRRYSYFSNVFISLLLACPRDFKQSTAQVIQALHTGLYAEERALNIASLLCSLREIDLSRHICSHYRCLLTLLSFIVALPFRYVSASVFSDIAWFASVFYNYTPYQGVALLHDFEKHSTKHEYLLS